MANPYHKPAGRHTQIKHTSLERLTRAERFQLMFSSLRHAPPTFLTMTTPPETTSALDEQVGGGHYKSLVIQPVEYCQKNKLPYCEGAVVKYVTRHRHKGGAQDIEKAIHFLQLLLEIEYPNRP